MVRVNLFYHNHLTRILPYNQAKKQTKYKETKKQKQIKKKCRDAFCFEYQVQGLLKGSSPIGVWLYSYLRGRRPPSLKTKNVMLQKQQQQQQQQILLNITIKTLQYNR